MSPFLTRLVFVLLIARAIVAPLSIRHQHAERTSAGFHISPDDGAPAVLSENLGAQFDDGRPDHGLVFRVCHWPAPRGRHASSELARRAAKPSGAARDALPPDRLRRSTASLRLPGGIPNLSLDNYLHHALGQQRC